jgi:hypothetical protein
MAESADDAATMPPYTAVQRRQDGDGPVVITLVARPQNLIGPPKSRC